MNYQEVLDYMYSQLPMYQRIGSAAYKNDLGKTLELDKYFNHPHKSFKTVHIAGTNGKGSTSHTIASILQEAGYKTGLYTSPHYLDFRERIKINGEKISKEYVVNFVEQNKAYFQRLKPSFFEITVAMAFEYFKDQQIDIAVIEVGMGGRLDSTNIIHPIISAITNIGWDHMKFLGNTLPKIAAEKAGIIKETVPVVVGKMPSEVLTVFEEKAKEKNAPLFLANENFKILKQKIFYEKGYQTFEVRDKEQIIKDLKFGLLGQYQALNLPVILQIADLLNSQGFKLTEGQLRAGMLRVTSNTGIVGRWQVVQQNPLTILDAGHNKDGIEQVVRQIKQTPHDNLHIVFGTVNDKDIKNILKLLPQNATYYFTKSSVPRSLDATVLCKTATESGLKGKSFPTVKQAVDAAMNKAAAEDLIFIGGSTFVVADALKLF